MASDRKYIEYKTKQYRRIASIPARFVVEALQRGEKFLFLNEFLTDVKLKSGLVKISIASNRIGTYIKGCKCAQCGIEGHFFAVERSVGSTYHLNAYHISSSGREIMMTSDHIVAKANGGNNSLQNRQPMCCYCNSVKSHYKSYGEAVSIQVQRVLIKHLDRYYQCIEMKKQYPEHEDKWNSVLCGVDKRINKVLQQHFVIP